MLGRSVVYKCSHHRTGAIDIFGEPTQKCGSFVRSYVVVSTDWGERFGDPTHKLGRSVVLRFSNPRSCGDRLCEPTHKLGRSVVLRFSNPRSGAIVLLSQHTSWVVRSFLDFRIIGFGRSLWGTNIHVGSFKSFSNPLIWAMCFGEPTYTLGR